MLSAYSDHPIFWLLAGTGPLVIGLTLIAFLRHLSNMRRARTRLFRNAQGNAARWANPKPEFKIRRLHRLRRFPFWGLKLVGSKGSPNAYKAFYDRSAPNRTEFERGRLAERIGREFLPGKRAATINNQDDSLKQVQESRD
jgi:hypothetical protein